MHPSYLQLLPYQRALVESNARFTWNNWSRQVGKSFTLGLRRVLRGLVRRRNQIILSAGERQCREVIEKIKQHCSALQITCDAKDDTFFQGLSVKQLEVQLPRGVRIIALPANPMTARGYTGDVMLDEFAMHADDRAIWAALFPTLLRGDGELDIASTPHGKANLFYELSTNDAFEHSTVTVHDAIRQGLQADADSLRQSMNNDALYRQEFLCEFLDEASALLPWDQITACVDQELTPTDSVEGLARHTEELFVGVDVGRTRDLTAIWVLALDPASAGFSLVGQIEMHNTPFREQHRCISEIMSLPRVRRCCVDAGGIGMQLAEELVEAFGAHRVEPILLTNALKSQLAGGLKIAVESQRIRIPQDEALIRDWHSVERTITESGLFRITAPRREGSHADRFWAAALALHAADASCGRAEAFQARPLHYAGKGTW